MWYPLWIWRTLGFDNDWMKNLPRPRFSKDEIKAATSGHHGTSTGLRTPKPMLIRITEKVFGSVPECIVQVRHASSLHAHTVNI